MPPRSFSIYQPVRSHSFVDFGLSGGLEGLRWSNVPVADPAQFADSIVDRSPQLNSLCSIKQLRASTFPDQSFTPPCHNDVRVVLNKAMHDGCEATSNHHGTHFTIAALPQKELLNLAKNSTNEWVREWRAGCNNSSSLGLFEVSGTIHLLWTTGSNGQFLMCTPLDVSGALADPSSALNSSLPAFDCSSIPANKCFTHQRISNIEVICNAHLLLVSLITHTSSLDDCSRYTSTCLRQVLLL